MREEDFHNRLQKRDRHLARWAERWPTNAYRVYDWDIPEWAFAVDRYGEHVHLQHFVNRRESAAERDRNIERAEKVVSTALEVPAERIHVKERRRQKGGAQYEKHEDEIELWVFEGDHEFRVDLEQYLDTGLFLDHRETRRMVAEEVAERTKPRLANLFAYTGAFSVWAAAAGATVTTVDLSNTYLDWAGENFARNNLSQRDHRFDRSDVLRWLTQEYTRGERYDFVVLDPPTFSRSKKMLRDLDIQKDHVELIRGSMALLNPGGVLYFSTNFRGFELDAESLDVELEEITHRTIPEDFREGIHRCWRGAKG